jgi:hypothetical protein
VQISTLPIKQTKIYLQKRAFFAQKLQNYYELVILATLKSFSQVSQQSEHNIKKFRCSGSISKISRNLKRPKNVIKLLNYRCYYPSNQARYKVS